MFIYICAEWDSQVSAHMEDLECVLCLQNIMYNLNLIYQEGHVT